MTASPPRLAYPRGPSVPRAAPALALAVALAGWSCSPSGPGVSGGPGKLPSDALDQAIAQRIGDPATCVILADRATGKTLYRYGALFNCVRGLPACDRPGDLTATQALALAGAPGGRHASCSSNADGSRQVGWAEGRATSKSRDLVYSAMMEGQSAMPGEEIAARLDDAFQTAGL